MAEKHEHSHAADGKHEHSHDRLKKDQQIKGVEATRVGGYPPSGVRESWDHYFMRLVEAISTRATCNRRKFGALLARDHFILSTGYNGSARGLPHCTDVGCKLIHGHCVRTIHAEQNAIISAARNGINVNGATLYSSGFPCLICAKLLSNLGIKRIVYKELYYKEEYKEELEFTQELFKEAGIETIQIK